MRPFALILALLLPATDTFAQARKDSVRHQNNHLSVQPNQRRQAPNPRQWPQDQKRTQTFCDQYARAAASNAGNIQGSNAGKSFGEQTGYLFTRDKKQAEALGMIGGAIGSAAGTRSDQQFYQFHLHQCLSGGKLITTPK